MVSKVYLIRSPSSRHMKKNQIKHIRSYFVFYQIGDCVLNKSYIIDVAIF